MSGDSPVDRAVDELELQAWLARAELRNPSLSHPGAREEIGALARLRDELRLQISLGRLEARDEWRRLEGRWHRLKVAAEAEADDASETFHDVMAQIRDGYHRLRDR